MSRLPLSDAECARELGLTREQLLLARVPVADRLLALGEAFAAAQVEADRILNAARAPLIAKAREAYGLGMGFEAIAQCTGERRLTNEGKRLRTPGARGVVTHSTIKRWLVDDDDGVAQAS